MKGKVPQSAVGIRTRCHYTHWRGYTDGVGEPKVWEGQCGGDHFIIVLLQRIKRAVYFIRVRDRMINVRSRLHGLRLFLALVAGIMAAPAGAVGIGQAKVESFLGEPLRVRVAISFAPGENITGACVRIASPPGQESPFIPDLAKASFQLIEGPRGAELMITTRRPYTDPILVFPLKVGCGAGGVYREITLLIDPPGMAAPTRAARPGARARGLAGCPAMSRRFSKRW